MPHLFHFLVMQEMEVWEQVQEREGHPLKQVDRIQRFFKKGIKETMNRNSFAAATTSCRIFCDYTAPNTLELYGVAAPNRVLAKDDAACSRLRSTLMGKQESRFTGLLKKLRRPNGESRFQARRPSDEDFVAVRECLQRFRPWNTDHVVPADYAIHPSRAGCFPSLLPFDENDPHSEDEVEIKRLHLFFDEVCFNRLALALELEEFQKHLWIPMFFDGADGDEIARSSGSGNGGVMQIHNPFIDVLGDIRDTIARESHKRRLIARGPLFLRVDGVALAPFEKAYSSTLESADLLEVVGETNDGAEVVIAAHVLTYDGEPRRERFEIEIKRSETESDQFVCECDYYENEHVHVTVEQMRPRVRILGAGPLLQTADSQSYDAAVTRFQAFDHAINVRHIGEGIAEMSPLLTSHCDERIRLQRGDSIVAPVNVNDDRSIYAIGMLLKGNQRIYRLARRIGYGRSREAWEATDERNNRVIVKLPLLDPDEISDAIVRHLVDLTAKFHYEREALTRLAGLDCAAEFLDYGLYNVTVSGKPIAVPFIVQRLIHGVRLEQYLATFFPSRADHQFHGIPQAAPYFKWAFQITRALLQIHQRQVVHGDIWIENIMVEHDDKIVFIDFGEALLHGQVPSNKNDTHDGVTKRLVASEGTLSVPADIYSLGGVLFTLATGQTVPDFECKTMDDLKDTIVAIVRNTNPSLYLANCGIVDVIARTLRSHQAERSHGADAVLRDLGALQHEPPQPKLSWLVMDHPSTGPLSRGDLSCGQVSEELVDAVLESLVKRDFEAGFRLLDTIAPYSNSLDLTSRNVQVFLGRLAAWVEAGYRRDWFDPLFNRFTKEVVGSLTPAPHACFQVAQAVVDSLAGKFEPAAERLDRVLRGDLIESEEMRMVARFIMARCWCRIAQYDLAKDEALAVLNQATEGGHPEISAVVSIMLAWLLLQDGKSREALKDLKKARGSLSGTEDYASLGSIEECFARLCRRRGRHDLACEHYDRAIKLYRQCGGQRNLARALAQKASDELLWSLQVARECKTRWSTASKQAAAAEQLQQLFGNLHILARQDATLRYQVQDPSTKLRDDDTADLAAVHHLRSQAWQHLEEAAEKCAHPPDRRGLGIVEIFRGYWHIHGGDTGQAMACVERAEQTSYLADPVLLARIAVLKCIIMLEQAGEAEGAIQRAELTETAFDLASTAVDWAGRTNRSRLKGKAVLWLGMCHALLGNLDKARELCRQADGLLKPAGRDYVQADLDRLRCAITDFDTAQAALCDLLQSAYAGRASLKELQAAFSGIIVSSVYNLTGGVESAAEWLRTAPGTIKENRRRRRGAKDSDKRIPGE